MARISEQLQRKKAVEPGIRLPTVIV